MALSTISSSSSFSLDTSPWRYDVFLSFRGEDTRNTFTAHLYLALNRKGILTYLDEEKLRRGDEISPALLQAIEDSRIFIIVLSKNYASSTWCLDELLKMLDQSKKSKQQRLLPVFYHVDPSNVRNQKESFGEALAKHAEKLNVDHMKLQLWKAALQEVANLSGYHLIRNGGNESEFIEEIVQDISRMANDHLYLHVAEHPVGLKPHVEDVSLLLSIGTKDIRMIGIFGVGGIGKTTLVKAIYNLIAFRFEASCFLPIDSVTWNQVNRLVQLQETLLFNILGECRSLKVDNIDTGISKIKRRLHSKRVLLILDGVDHLDQLKTLAAARDWFGKGSRIIITTRDQHLLTAHGVDSTYEMTGLNQDDAFQLFCWHAFRSEKPVDGYGEFVEQIINYAGSLPLVLTVLGSDLYGRTKKEWVSAMDEYKKIPHQDIQKILQTSYDRLSENEKNVFLDIACFFNGQWLDDVIIKILDSFGFFPNSSIPRLREKCLISKSDRRLQMHDLLRDMGREVVRQESLKNPGARSRLFFHKDVRKVLEEDIGTYRVEAIAVDLPEGADIIRLSPKAFKNMKRLRLFRCRNAHFSGEPNCLPNSVSVLDWPNCPLQSMPSEFRGDELFILRMPGSRIQEIHLEYFKAKMIFPGNKIPDWFSHCKETSNGSHRCEFDIKGSPRCVGKFNEMDSDHVWFEHLRPRIVEPVDNDLRIIFESDPNLVTFKCCGVHLSYKNHEQNVKDDENVDVHLDAPIEDIGNLANPMDHGSQISKRRRVDYDDDDRNVIESDLYPQQTKPASTLDIKLFLSTLPPIDPTFFHNLMKKYKLSRD
ncbi:disease resistance protein RUN1-like isoform X2 [Juglans microcarpa x Juglans regia]|uniref:disease resistance protein RUN1-like isoform X2 n=1 Tax=Juglans microcarpa x Juglans regia TaxID=2249226 RepID=UPI001B7EEF37|nr:disease resistance protein RUN1-like isoform X2 [Juglans microcarpa x Juglans regia]